MKLLVLCEGRIRERHFRDACAEYAERLAHYGTVEVREVDRLQPRDLPDGLYVVALDERGRETTSEEFAAWLQRRMTSGGRGICFVIGGADGISQEIAALAKEQLSLSRMTLPHRLARVVLLEQLYRAMTILRGEPYHR